MLNMLTTYWVWVTEANQVVSRVFDKLPISQSSVVVCQLNDLEKEYGTTDLLLTIPKYCKTFDLLS